MDKFVIVQEAKEVDNSSIQDEFDKIDWIKNNDYIVDTKEIKLIRDFIEKKMNNSQKIQVVEIIKESASKYTTNKNGYFINMNNINNDTLLKIKRFVDFTKKNAKELQKTEDILNEEKTRIESIDKIEEETNNFSSTVVEENPNEKNINFEIFSLDSVQSEIFDEYKESNEEEIEFCGRMTENEKRDDSGYKIILKRYKKKYLGNKAKVLKKFRDISRISINSKSAKTSLNQNTIKPVVKTKTRKVQSQPVENAIVEETNTGVDEYIVEEEDDDEVEAEAPIEEDE